MNYTILPWNLSHSPCTAFFRPLTSCVPWDSRVWASHPNFPGAGTHNHEISECRVIRSRLLMIGIPWNCWQNWWWWGGRSRVNKKWICLVFMNLSSEIPFSSFLSDVEFACIPKQTTSYVITALSSQDKRKLSHRLENCHTIFEIT